MKKTLISAFFILLAVAFVGCKDEKKGWDYLYGYTNDDIIGTYHFSNVADAFESLTPSEYCYLCDDAEVTISSYQENSVKFTIKCPEEGYNQTFTGRPTYNEDDFLINMSVNPFEPNTEYTVTASVYTNAKGEIRLHGFARKIIYGVDLNQQQFVQFCYNYYFDVIKD